jgi:hypothetical protein
MERRKTAMQRRSDVAMAGCTTTREKIFAAACMCRKVGFGLVDAIVKEFDAPSAECGGVH